MARQLGHERLAEAHDLGVGLALRVEVASALAAAHRQRREAVLENLLEAEELQHAEVDSRVEAQAALVGPDGAVVFDAETAVHVDLALVVGPRHAELDDALGFDHALENGLLLVNRVALDHDTQRLENLGDRLDELGLVCVLLFDVGEDVVYVGHACLLCSQLT